MAKAGTRYSDVNFTIPAGADPMGVGVLDLGRSSFDPIEWIRSGIEQQRQDRLLEGQNRREEYFNYIDKLPTFEAVNQKVASKLNSDVVKMGEYAYKNYRLGDWSPFAKTDKGLPVQQELNRLETEIADKGAAYNAMLPKYKSAYDYVSDPENFDKIDWDLTNGRMRSFTDAEDVKGMTQALNKPLVVLKPEPVELADWLKGQISTYIPGEDKDIASKVFDPNVNKFLVTETTFKDPIRVANGMKKIYKTADDKYKNEINRRYERAPEEEKTTSDGVNIPVEDWFAAQYVPEYAKKLDLSTYAVAEKKKQQSWGFLPSRNDAGVYDLSTYEERKPLGVKVGDQSVSQYFQSAATIPLQGVTRKTFVMPNTSRAVDADTGSPITGGKSALNYLDNVSILPVAARTTSVIKEDGSTKTITAGSKISEDDQRLMADQKKLGDIQWEAFLTTLTTNRQVPQSEDISSLPPEYQALRALGLGGGAQTSSFMNTTIRPWNESVQYVKAAAEEDDKDITPLINTINDILDQLNSDYGKVFQDIKAKNEEEAYQSLFE